MSFGAPASTPRGRRPARTDLCPCGRRPFGECCGPVLDGGPAETAEDLMRSRYTAFALGDEQHLWATWSPRTRPDDVTVDPDVEWTGLEIVSAAEDTVRFRAHWRDLRSGERGVQEEHSRFLRRGGRWFYLSAL